MGRARKFRIVLAAAFVLGASAAFAAPAAKKAPAAVPAKKAAPAGVAAQKPQAAPAAKIPQIAGNVAPLVNGKPISENEVIDLLVKQQGVMVLDRLVTERLLNEEAAHRKVTVTPAQISGRIKEMVARPGFQEALSRSRMTMADLQYQVRLQMLFEAMTKGTPEEEKKYFEANHDRYDTPEQLAYSRMILKSKADADAARKEIVENKRDFAAVAKEKSVDEMSKAQGGEMPNLTVGRGYGVQSDIEKTLKGLKPGEVSQPFTFANSKDAWLMVKLKEILPAKPATLQSAKKQVEDGVSTEKGQVIRQRLNELKAKAKLQILDARFSALTDQYRHLNDPQPPPGMMGAMSRPMNGPMGRPMPGLPSMPRPRPPVVAPSAPTPAPAPQPSK